MYTCVYLYAHRHVYTCVLTDMYTCVCAEDCIHACVHSCTVQEKEVSLQEILGGFEFVPGLFGIVLRGRYLYGAWPRTVLILIEFKCMVPELWQLVVFCTCRILPEGLKYAENFHYG